MGTYSDSEAVEFGIFALAVGREARGTYEAYDPLLGVAYSISNRVEIVKKRPGFWNWGRDWLSVLSAKEQYSSMTPPAFDPNLLVYPDLSQVAWKMVLSACEEAYWRTGVDPTGGAVSYFSPPANPAWAASPLYTFALALGPFKFYRLTGT